MCTGFWIIGELPCRYAQIVFEKTALEIQATERLTIQSARQLARVLAYRDGLSYADILNCGTVPSRRSPCVRFSPPLSSRTPAFTVSEFMSPKRTSFYIPSGITTLNTSN